MTNETTAPHGVSGRFVDFADERYYMISNVDQMEPFFISLISNVDHWLFVSSTGGLTAGRVSPKTALFPYITVDKIHESAPHTGGKTLLRVNADGQTHGWEPFNREHDYRYSVSRNLYKNTLGNKLYFEEINHDLNLMFRYSWATSDEYGFVRQCELINTGNKPVSVELLDGMQNMLPAGAPQFAQTNTSNLVDAYKWSELDASTGLACLTLYSGISDRAEPCESLRASTIFSLGLEDHKTLISSEQIRTFAGGGQVEQETHKRGIRGAYFVNATVDLAAGGAKVWRLVANSEQSQSDVVALRQKLRNPSAVDDEITQSINDGSDDLARIMANGDAFQSTAEENVSVHHYANVLFNILRGGVFHDQYQIPSSDFASTVRQFNRGAYERNREFLNNLPTNIDVTELSSAVAAQNDPQLERLTHDYLPITFGRRHGDPSRPWNEFAIRVKDEHGNGILSYQGNWRDIFQNWEALLISYPEFIENVIAKFVNASTADGYNPYRITKEGIDWEVEEPDNPWSYIGYWGDHQIIYLQKLLELSNDFHPAQLHALLHRKVFSYANVPYRITTFESQLKDPKNTVTFDEDLAARIDERVARIGADGKLVMTSDGDVYLVTLFEKLLVPLLSKLGNLVIDGGIWLTTQRPEWNDANNALVGHGLSMVTLYYMRRYISFFQQLLAEETGSFSLSAEVDAWFGETASALRDAQPLLGKGAIGAADRFAVQKRLGQAACDYRCTFYKQESFSGTVQREVGDVKAMLESALAAIDHSIGTNRREDGLYHAYNLIELQGEAITVDTLYPMLEGQVAALSAGAIDAKDAVTLLDALFASDVYREDQNTFMLYPDRQLPDFLERNRFSPDQAKGIPLLGAMLENSDSRLISLDVEGHVRFNADFKNAGDLNTELGRLTDEYGKVLEDSRDAILELYEDLFNHKAFTGRSGTMFGFEGLGSVYWHMVSKLLLAVMENFFSAVENGTDAETCRQLGKHYYRVRNGIGFNKTPEEYGAFPTDPYSHTPKHAGARQPGMTGQVKEEVVSRFAELGVRFDKGTVKIRPALLREREFVQQPQDLRYLDTAGNWQVIVLPSQSLAFTWCQVPVIYTLDDTTAPHLEVTFDDGEVEALSSLELPAEHVKELIRRSGRIKQLFVSLNSQQLLAE